jgi:hypothetical protein
MDIHHTPANGLDTPGRPGSTSDKNGRANKKPGLNIGSAGIGIVPGLFSELFNVAASRPAQMTTGSIVL